MRPALPSIVLAAFLVLVAGSGAAWSDVASCRGTAGMGFRQASFRGRDFGHRHGNGRHFAGRRHDRRGFLPIYGGPYWDWYGYGYEEDEYEYEPEQAPAGQPRRTRHSGYCDVSAGPYPQICVWKEGP